MLPYQPRTYRALINPRDLVSFQVTVKETDLFIHAESDLSPQALALVLDARYQLEAFIRQHPDFATTLSSYPRTPHEHPLAREMVDATRDLNVGPMASVAGAIAEYVGRGLLSLTRQIIIENGGDIFLSTNRPVNVSVFAGTSPLSERIGLRIPVNRMPLGICTSSGTVGHSLSMGKADAVCVLSSSATLSDAAATALGNRIRNPGDLQHLETWARNMKGVWGCVVILGKTLAAWGDVELIEM